MINRFKNLSRFQLSVLFAAIVFLIMLITMGIMIVGTYLLFKLSVIDMEGLRAFPLFMFGFAALLVGTIIAALFSSKPLYPVRELVRAADRIAKGDYGTRVQLGGPTEFKQLSDSFNHMAIELGSVEILRTDFVNNFSHEFKTPIVSIRGFAKMLKMDDLTDAERNEYIDIIINESDRLAELSSNVLNLSRLEQQESILDREPINVTEEIRLAIALLDGKWSDKQIDFNLKCQDVMIQGNREMIKQVWINLLDNAIKFSPKGGSVDIFGSKSRGELVVDISNIGEELTELEKGHIFDKFYQSDKSHKGKGNGLGLNIASRIVELHGGKIQVLDNTPGRVVFRTTLKCK